MHVPAETKVIVPDEIVHTKGVAEVRVTASELLAVAETAYVPLPKVLLFSEPNVIVCEALPGVAITCALVLLPAAFIALTPNVYAVPFVKPVKVQERFAVLVQLAGAVTEGEEVTV